MCAGRARLALRLLTEPSYEVFILQACQRLQSRVRCLFLRWQGLTGGGGAGLEFNIGHISDAAAEGLIRWQLVLYVTISQVQNLALLENITLPMTPTFSKH